MRHKQFVGRVVGHHQLQRQVLLRQILHAHPRLPALARERPLLQHDAGQRLGAKHIGGLQITAALQMQNAQAQVTELPADFVHNAQRKPRTEDLVFHHFIAQQLKLLGYVGR